MCNRYRNAVIKAGMQWEVFGFEHFSETRIPLWANDLPIEVFPDRRAMVVTLCEDGRPVLRDMRWGFPPVKGGKLVTNLRNPNSPYWRPWLAPEQRCLVVATSFAEWSPGPPRGDYWFDRVDGAPFAFAGVWRSWTGARGTKGAPVHGEHRLFAFLTCEPNDVVRPHHPKAMPVILGPQDAQTWLGAPPDIALELQRPLPSHELRLAQTPDQARVEVPPGSSDLFSC